MSQEETVRVWGTRNEAPDTGRMSLKTLMEKRNQIWESLPAPSLVGEGRPRPSLDRESAHPTQLIARDPPIPKLWDLFHRDQSFREC